MNLLYLITRGDSIGGAQIHVRDLAQHMAATGHEVTVAMGTPGPLSDQLDRSGVRVEIVRDLVRAASPLTDVRAVRSLRSLLRDVSPQLVSTHSSKAGTVGRIAARLERVPCLFTAHGWSFTDGVNPLARIVYFSIEAAVAGIGPALICVSQHDEHLVRRVPWMRARATTVHNAVHDVPESMRSHPEIGSRAVMTGRLDRQKDHESLFHALTEVSDLSVDLIGEGPDRPQLEALARRLGLEERVRFLGQVDDVHRHLASASLFLLPSRWEGLPRSILEAMRAGLPVVASDVGGVAELVVDGTTGTLVAREDVGGLARALATYVGDPILRATHGSAGRSRFEQRFRFDRLVDETITIYQNVLRAAGSR